MLYISCMNTDLFTLLSFTFFMNIKYLICFPGGLGLVCRSSPTCEGLLFLVGRRASEPPEATS